jgi:integrase
VVQRTIAASSALFSQAWMALNASLARVSTGAGFSRTGFQTSVFAFLHRLEDAGQVGDGLTIHGLRHTCGTLMKELGFDLDTIADMLGQETAGMAAWYARDAQLERKLAGVVEAIDEQLGNKTV